MILYIHIYLCRHAVWLRDYDDRPLDCMAAGAAASAMTALSPQENTDLQDAAWAPFKGFWASLESQVAQNSWVAVKDLSLSYYNMDI